MSSQRRCRALLAMALVVHAAAASTPGGQLKIVVLVGQEASRQVGAAAAAPLVVEVRDGAERPLPNVEVTFELPADGPSGAFVGGARVYTARTNQQGQAATAEFQANRQPGRYAVTVTARRGTDSASISVKQVNSLTAPVVAREPVVRERSGMWKYLLLIGSAAATGSALALTRGSGGEGGSAPSNISVVPGAIGVGSPR